MMNRTQNPTEGGKEPRAYNSNVRDEMLGFINRNQQTSESVSAPSLIFPLGNALTRNLEHLNRLPSVSAAGHKFASWDRNNNVPDMSLGGIMVYDFQPVLANTDSYGQSDTSDIFVNKWIEIRQVYTGADNFQPGDIQCISIGLMLIEEHLANIKRFLDMVGTIANDPQNFFHSLTAMTAAYGFPMTDEFARKHWVEWRNFYNTQLLGSISKIKWIKDLVPGRKRWASLCKEFYKDNDFDTSNVQISFLRPASFWQMTENIDPETFAVTWSFNEEPLYTIEVDAEGALSFNAYLAKVNKLIKTLFYDSGNINVLNGVCAVIAQGNRRGLGDAEFYTLGDEHEPVQDGGTPISLTYDFLINCALHNATILEGLVFSSPSFNPSSGAVSQIAKAVADTPASWLAYNAKIINVPHLGLSNSDFFAVTQWAVAAELYPGSVLTEGFPPSSFGTDVITSATMYTFRYDIGTNTASVNAVPFKQLVGTQENLLGVVESQMTSIATASHFQMAPLIYVEGYQNGSSSDMHIYDIIGEAEIIYGASGYMLSKFHKVMTQNFWGFPISPALGEGAPNFTIDTFERR